MPSTDKIAVTFMRHGRSRADDERVHEGRYDSPLTDVGREQIRKRAAQWVSAGTHFDRIIASPLLRAFETAQIVGAALGDHVEADEGWMERDNGPLAGLPFDVAEQRYPTPPCRNPYTPFGGFGESDWALYCRAAAAVERVIRRGPGEYLVVAHGNVLKAAMWTIIGVPPQMDPHGVAFAFGDAGYLRATYRPETNHWLIMEFTRS